MFEKTKAFLLKQKSKIAAFTLTAGATIYSATPTFAAEGKGGVSTGNADLDTLVGNLDTGMSSMKTGALYIISGAIVIGIAIFGIKWLWGIFRGWMAQAK